MKKYLIFGLLILALAAFVIVPFFKNKNVVSEQAADDLPAMFSFKENLATKGDEVVTLKIAVNSSEIKQLELIYNDSVIAMWDQPKAAISYSFKAGELGVGTRSLILHSLLKDGSTFDDERMVRVLSEIVPEKWTIEKIAAFPHNSTSFTQGLEFNKGELFESTGQRGQSIIAKVNLKSGAIEQKMGLDGTYFGEGITVFKDKIYQLTWQEQKCFVYNKKTFQVEKDIPYNGEGWGLCNNGTSLIMSNGSERIVFRNPITFEIERTIEVYNNEGPIANLNELEYVDDLIYANVWMTNFIVVIDPNNGKVLAQVDATSIVSEGKGTTGDVLNGIAYNPATSKWYLTGKNWAKLFEVKFKKA
jgi:glutamine cyclotransferase